MPQDTKKDKFHSVTVWKERFFPELAREDTYEILRKDSGKLAQVLANDTIDRLGRRRGT